jgi:hypothetical protein
LTKFADVRNDEDLELFKSATRFVDNQIAKIDRDSQRFDDPDESGHYDRGEYMIGLGFISCQQYIAAVCAAQEISKSEALVLGPIHRSNVQIARIVDAAANYWKHSMDEDRTSWKAAQRKANEEILRHVGVDLDQSYVLSNVLAALLEPHPARFKPLIPFLKQWRDTVSRNNDAARK